ncbi:hypothetical protein VNI00_015622 [Paramarasmius palmivorus]|uniref:Uncharacterized protein n=1 Tax=Paramarasmius palmivorus TaxID=297713 RepID=A0AAW0BJS5_9AGAR
MLWLLLILLAVQVSPQQYHKIIIEDVQTSWAPASAIALNITWNFNDGEHKPNEKPLFALVQASDDPLIFNATEACELAAPCLLTFSLTPSISGELKFHLQAHLENGSEDFDDRQIAVNVTGSIVNVSVLPSSSPTPTISIPGPSSPSTTSAASHNPNPDRPTIIGAVVGSVIAFILITVALISLLRRRSRRRKSAIGFNRNMMVKGTGDLEVEADIDPRRHPDHRYSSLSTASEIVSDSELTEKQTERQMEIDERLHHLNDLLGTLESQPQAENDGSIGKVKDRIKRFTVLKEGDWAREISDEKPVELS